jgi:DNA-binding CsgD family transcriptional regulator
VTSREMDVLRLVADGLSNREIGARLFLSPRTVETHVASLQRRTRSSTRADLVALASAVLARESPG